MITDVIDNDVILLKFDWFRRKAFKFGKLYPWIIYEWMGNEVT